MATPSPVFESARRKLFVPKASTNLFIIWCVVFILFSLYGLYELDKRIKTLEKTVAELRSANSDWVTTGWAKNFSVDTLDARVIRVNWILIRNPRLSYTSPWDSLVPSTPPDGALSPQSHR